LRSGPSGQTTNRVPAARICRAIEEIEWQCRRSCKKK